MIQEIINTILGGLTIVQLISYFVWSILGFITSLLIEIIRHRKTVKERGGFSIKYWIADNSARFLLTIVAMIVGIVFSTQMLNIQPSIFEAFSAGLISDKIIEAIIKLKDTLNINNGGNAGTTVSN